MSLPSHSGLYRNSIHCLKQASVYRWFGLNGQLAIKFAVCSLDHPTWTLRAMNVRDNLVAVTISSHLSVISLHSCVKRYGHMLQWACEIRVICLSIEMGLQILHLAGCPLKKCFHNWSLPLAMNSLSRNLCQMHLVGWQMWSNRYRCYCQDCPFPS